MTTTAIGLQTAVASTSGELICIPSQTRALLVAVDVDTVINNSFPWINWVTTQYSFGCHSPAYDLSDDLGSSASEFAPDAYLRPEDPPLRQRLHSDATAGSRPRLSLQARCTVLRKSTEQVRPKKRTILRLLRLVNARFRNQRIWLCRSEFATPDDRRSPSVV